MEKRQELQWNRGILPKAALTLAIQLPFFRPESPVGNATGLGPFFHPGGHSSRDGSGTWDTDSDSGESGVESRAGLESAVVCHRCRQCNPGSFKAPRLLAIGEHQFRAHYMGSSSLVEAGIQRFSAEDQLKQRRAVLERLKEVHVPGNDLEYAGLLDAQGAAWLAATKDPREALKWHQQALESYPLLRTNIYHLVVCHMMVGDPVQAFQFAPTLVAMGHPDPEKSLRMGVHVAVAAGKRLEALEWAQRLRRRDPTRDFYRTLEQQLAGNTPLPTILPVSTRSLRKRPGFRVETADWTQFKTQGARRRIRAPSD